MANGEIVKKLPPWAIGVLSVGGLVIIGFVGYKIYKKIEENKRLAGAKKEGTDIDNDLKNAGAPSMSNSQISQLANALFVAMDGYGTDVPAIYREIAKLKNNADVLAVKKVYGIRELSSGAGNPAPNFKGTLSQAFIDELETTQVNAINGVLAKKGITQRF